MIDSSSSIPPAKPGERLHRCFYAISVGTGIASYLEGIVRELRRHGANMRWAPPGNIHLTLRFLGELPNDLFKLAMAQPDNEEPFDAMTIRASGLGAFPQMRSPTIIWAGVDTESQRDRDRLVHLQSRSEQWAQRIGLAPDRRRFRPHLTLGRVRRPPDNVREVIDDITTRSCFSPLHRVDELLLMRSTLAPGGSEYEVVKRWGMV